MRETKRPGWAIQSLYTLRYAFQYNINEREAAVIKWPLSIFFSLATRYNNMHQGAFIQQFLSTIDIYITNTPKEYLFIYIYKILRKRLWTCKQNGIIIF